MYTGEGKDESAGVVGVRNNEKGSKNVSNLVDAKERFNNKLANSSQLIDSLQNLVVKELKNQTVVKESGDGASSKKILELELKIKDLKAEVYDLKEILAESREGGVCAHCDTSSSEFKNSLALIEDLKRKMRNMKTQHLAALQAEKDLHSETETRRAQIEAVRAELLVEHSQLSNEHGELKRQHDSMFSISPEQYSQLSAENGTLKSALQQALGEKAAIEQAFEKAKEKNTAENIETGKKLLGLTKDFTAIRKNMEADLLSQKTERNTHEGEKKAFLEDIKTLNRKLSEMTEQKNRVQKELEAERKKHRRNEIAQNRTTITESPSAVKTVDHFAANTSSTSHAGAMVSPQQQQQQQFAFDSNPLVSEPFSPPRFNPSSEFSVLANHSQEHSYMEPLVQSFNMNQDSNYSNNNISTNNGAYYVPYVPYIPDPSNPIDAINHFNAASSVTNSTSHVSYHATYAANSAAAVTYHPNSSAVGLSADGEPVKPHLRVVYVLHHAPQKYSMSQDDIEQELARFGALRYVKPVKDSPAYFAEYYDKCDADDALENFPLHVNGFKVSCKVRFNQLPTSKVIAHRDNSADSRARHGSSTSNSSTSQRVILHDPLLTSKPHCTICEEAGRHRAASTHCADRCYHRFKVDASNSSSRGASNTSSGGTAQRKRDRSKSPEPPKNKINFTNRTNSRELDSGGITGNGVGDKDGAYVKKSRDEEGREGTFNPVAGMRPLSTAR